MLDFDTTLTVCKAFTVLIAIYGYFNPIHPHDKRYLRKETIIGIIWYIATVFVVNRIYGLLEKNHTSFNGELLNRYYVKFHIMFEMPFVPAVILWLLVYDFGTAVIHIVTHRVPFLWKFHRMHHSGRVLNNLVSERFHFFELYFRGYAEAFIYSIFIFSKSESFVVAYAIAQTWGAIQHSNAKLTWLEKFNFIICTPQYHAIHHARDEKLSQSNYGGILNIWDKMLGTYSTNQLPDCGFGLDEAYYKENDTALKEYFYPIPIWYNNIKNYFAKKNPTVETPVDETEKQPESKII